MPRTRLVTGCPPLGACQRDPAHRLSALIGRRSCSATANFIADLERLPRPVFVSEASSECCNPHDDASHVVLPCSGAEAELSAVRWNLSRNVLDARCEVSHDVPVRRTARAVQSGIGRCSFVSFITIPAAREREVEPAPRPSRVRD